jgi:hypothetical protein
MYDGVRFFVATLYRAWDTVVGFRWGAALAATVYITGFFSITVKSVIARCVVRRVAYCIRLFIAAVIGTVDAVVDFQRGASNTSICDVADLYTVAVGAIVANKIVWCVKDGTCLRIATIDGARYSIIYIGRCAGDTSNLRTAYLRTVT